MSLSIQKSLQGTAYLLILSRHRCIKERHHTLMLCSVVSGTAGETDVILCILSTCSVDGFYLITRTPA